MCDGSNVSRTDYAELFEALGTMYGNGDGSTTFGLPNLLDRFLQGSNTSGVYKEAGLPNITGELQNGACIDQAFRSFYLIEKNIDDSAYTYRGGTVTYVPGTAKTHPFYLIFDASKSSSIYGSSTTVQPPALTILPCIKY